MKMTAKARASIPSHMFGIPAKRAFPITDKAHAANAKARASEMFNKGKLSAAEKAKIDVKANKKLGKKGA